MCRSALSLNSLHSFHPTAAESQYLCCASRKPTGSIALDSMLDPHHPTAGHGDPNRFGSQSSMRAQALPLERATATVPDRQHRPDPESEADAVGDQAAVDLVDRVAVDAPCCGRGAPVERALALAKPGEVVAE